MISSEVVDEGLAALRVAATMLIEDAVEAFTIVTDSNSGLRQAAELTTLGADLSALGVAMTVLARNRRSVA